LLSHLLLGIDYRELPFQLLREDECRLFEFPGRLMRQDLRAMESLSRILTLSGFGMTLCGGSQPASQGEHLISHYMEFSQKRIDCALAEQLNGLLAELWSSIRERVSSVVMTPARMAEILAEVGAPNRPEALGWPHEFYKKTVREAREIRNRYTFLDLATDSGLLGGIDY